MFNLLDDIKDTLEDHIEDGCKINDGVQARLLGLAQFLDKFCYEIEAEDADFDVDPSHADAVIGVKVDELILQGGRTHPFFESTKMADRVRFSKSDDGSLLITFQLLRLWTK